MPEQNTLKPEQICCHFSNDIFKLIFLNENVCILPKISLKFVPTALLPRSDVYICWCTRIFYIIKCWVIWDIIRSIYTTYVAYIACWYYFMGCVDGIDGIVILSCDTRVCNHLIHCAQGSFYWYELALIWISNHMTSIVYLLFQTWPTAPLNE